MQAERRALHPLTALSNSDGLSIPHSDGIKSGHVIDQNEMDLRVRAFDWSQTPLGDPSDWPQSLKTIVRILLTSRYAMWMGWGPELTFLYNDTYASMTLGEKHPWALGKRADEVWREIWNDIGPRIESVLAGGVATWDE